MISIYNDINIKEKQFIKWIIILQLHSALNTNEFQSHYHNDARISVNVLKVPIPFNDRLNNLAVTLSLFSFFLLNIINPCKK